MGIGDSEIAAPWGLSLCIADLHSTCAEDMRKHEHRRSSSRRRGDLRECFHM
jgi:hypothetical protein